MKGYQGRENYEGSWEDEPPPKYCAFPDPSGEQLVIFVRREIVEYIERRTLLHVRKQIDQMLMEGLYPRFRKEGP